MLPLRAPTPWPVVWARALRSQHDIARQNALVATRVLAERRREREDVERYLTQRAAHHGATRRNGREAAS